MQRNRFLRTVGVFLLLTVLASSMYAFTAANTVADSNAGIGAGDVSGYDVSDITYSFVSGDASTINGVSFNLDKDANEVYARPNSDGSWATCAATGIDPAWDCAISVSTADLEGLQVSAAD